MSKRFGFDDETTLERFNYVAPKVNQIADMQQIREAFRNTVETILRVVPASADRTVALRAIHEANMLTNICVMFPENAE